MENPGVDSQDIEDVERPSSARRTFTLRNNAARQVAVNFMPSRQLPYNTLRLRRNNSEHNALLEDAEAVEDQPDAADHQADIIVREMELHQRLMENHPAAEELRREALRDLPQGLTMKRHVRAKLSASVSLRSKTRPISLWKWMKYRISFRWKRTQDRVRDVAFSVELWYEAIRTLEGQFGSAVGSYLYLLRWVFAADALLAVLLAAFLLAPQGLWGGGGGVGSGREGGWGVLDLISGKGAYQDSLLFYGHYHSGDVSAGALSYYMPFAYFFTMAALLLGAFGVLCYKTAYSYRRNFIETAGGLSHVFASKVFCGWDFGVVSAQAAALTKTSIYNEFKELLNEQDKNKISTTFCIKVNHYLVNIIVNVFILGMIVALEYGIWQLLSVEDVTSRWDILLSATVTAAIAILPVIFDLLVKFEYYTPRTALYVTLARTWLLHGGTLMMLYYYWTQSGEKCWETSFGQEMYRLVLLESLVSLIILPALEIFRGMLYKCNPTWSPPSFNVAYNCLPLVYNQWAVWLGAPHCPALAALVAAKLLLLFYVKRHCLAAACRPAPKIWRAAQTQTVLYMLVTLSLFVTLFAFGSLFLKMPSKECGPFREYEHVYEVLTEGVLGLSGHEVLSKIILFVTRPGVIGFLGLFLCVAVYYMRAKALAQHSMGELLRHMLVLQAKDKDFLLSAIDKVSNGEWLYSPKSDAEGPDSHTWKYLKEVRKPSNSGFHFDASRLSGRPHSYVRERGERGCDRAKGSDGDTDSSFSWKGSNSCLDNAADVEGRRD